MSNLYLTLLFILISTSLQKKVNELPPASDYSIPLYEPEEMPHSNLISFSEDLVEARMGKQTRQVINLYVGEPLQHLKVKLSTAICGIWLLDKKTFGHGFDYSSSSTFEDMGLDGKVDFTHGRMVKDYMKFVQTKSNQAIPFLLVTKVDDATKIPNNYDGLIGFGFQCRSKSVGNVNLMKMFEGKKVKKDIFSYTYDSTTGKGLFTIGGYAKKLDLSNKHYRTIPLDIMNINGHWEVNLHSVFFENGYMFKVDAPLSIGIGGAAFGVSQDLFDYIVGAYFFNYMEKGVCILTQEDVWEVFCDLTYDPSSFGSLGLVVGKWNFKLKPSMLFRTIKAGGETRYWFSIVYYKDHQGQFYLSQSLLEGINTVVYNREEYNIGLFEGEMQ